MLPLTSSLMYPYFLFMNQRKSEVIFIHQNLISNRLTYRCMQNQPVSKVALDSAIAQP